MDKEGLLQDKKEDLPLSGKDDPIELIMEFFASDDQTIGHLENLPYNREIYEELGWQNEKHFDVISSFWTVFSCAVITEVNGNSAYSRSKRFYRFPDYIYHHVPWVPGGKNGYVRDGEKQLSFPEKYRNPEFEGIKAVVTSTVSSYPKLKELAALTHSAANFMPCPSVPGTRENTYNHMKGIGERVHDFLPLMVDFIERHCGDEAFRAQVGGVTVDGETLRGWKQWLISNREVYRLEDYYECCTDERNVTQIKGIPFFQTQSLDDPLPRTAGEVAQCLDEMVRRIQNRAGRLPGPQIPDGGIDR